MCRKNRMEICATETESADSRKTLLGRPGHRRSIQHERTVLRVIPCIGFADIQRGRQNLVVKRLAHLDQSGHAGGAFCVADLAFHRSKTCLQRQCASSVIEFRQRLQFGTIAHHGTRAMRFDQTDICRHDLLLEIEAMASHSLEEA